jgi:cobalt-precorrin 5A hydrolase / precorrin-3B C17-methyltransferase
VFNDRNFALIGQIISGAASLRRATQIEDILGVQTRIYSDGAVVGLPQAWQECDVVISHLALGATTRIIAPLLRDKHTDPGLVVIDDAGRFVVPLVGGHGGGANELAKTLAAGLGATAVLTTATDSLGLPALDTLGWAASGEVATVTRAILDGKPVVLTRTQTWPLPPLPANVQYAETVADEPPLFAAQVLVTDELVTDESAADSVPTVLLNPPSLIAGMGCNRGTGSAALRQLLTATLNEHGLHLGSLAALTTVEAKADEPGLVELAAELDVPLLSFPAAQLSEVAVPNPSSAPAKAVGTPSVAEASVIAHGAELIVEKQRSPEATCAIGRLPALGKLSIVGLGPGARDLLTPRAVTAIQNATVLVGYRPYVNQIKDLIRPGTEILTTPMGQEAQRTGAAIEAARAGHNVVLVSSGDPAIYAMASPTLEQGTAGIRVEVIPGITASLAASAILGAPLGHDHATISLSDLHTDWDTICSRVQAAAQADLVTVFYNPRSRKRVHQLPEAMAIMAAHRPPETPVAVVTDATRPDQQVMCTTIAEFDPEVVNMHTLVLVGSSTTCYLPGGQSTVMVTPRDYRWLKK